jgi:hypothetical protein
MVRAISSDVPLLGLNDGFLNGTQAGFGICLFQLLMGYCLVDTTYQVGFY